MALLQELLKSLNARDLTDIHPKHLDAHFQSLAKKDPEQCRRDVLEYMKRLYCRFLAEDKIDGTRFDADILDALKRVETKV